MTQHSDGVATQSPATAWPPILTCLLAGVIVLGVEGLLLLSSNNALLHGRLFDPDCYMHLQRALRLMQHGWETALDPRVNAPFGYMIHWTNLFDSLLVGGASVMRLFGVNAHSALFFWGSAISPVLLIAALCVYAWGVRPWVSGAFFAWLTVLFFTQPQLSGAFIAGRPDHHSLILGLMMAQTAWLYAYFDERADWRWTLVAGALAGIQLSTSVEALVTIAMVIAVLGAAAMFYRLRVFGTLAIYLGSCVFVILCWLALEKGVFLFHAAYDRVSIVHVVALGSGAIAAAFLALADARGWLDGRFAVRAAFTASAAAAAGLVTAVTFPDFFRGPWPHLTPEVIAWHKSISELQPLWPSSWLRLHQFLAQFVASLLSLPLIVWGMRKRPNEPFLLIAFVGFVIFGGLALAQMRWAGELQACTLLPWALTTRRIMQSSLTLRLGEARLPLRSLGLIGALLLQITPAAIAKTPGPAVVSHAGGKVLCDWTGATTAMAAEGPPGSIVMTDLWYGPEILWRTDLRVVGAPYEITPAISDTDRFLRGDEKAMHAALLQRHVAFVLLCAQETSGGFADRLRRGEAPAWLVPLALSHLPEFRLYRVVQ